MHQAFAKMNIRFEEIGSHLRQHGATIESIQKDQTSKERNRARHDEVRCNGGNNRCRYEPMDEYMAENEFWEDDGDERASDVDRDRVTCRGGRQERGYRRDDEDRDLGKIKVTILSFQGKNELEAYLEWEKKVKLIFDCHNYLEEKKVKLAVIKFIDYAIIWWDQLVNNRRRNRERPIAMWGVLRALTCPSFPLMIIM
ncbi:hypothetical protein KPL71_021624 [Citrus sinensis]|uniref:Uncharacterized protein n=1 Tax=Citrus sinensis TaxID=2711 RepID=A0ACB8JG60_CITSI|nr:hypothetical protein KPL71_021624 [Citrus sinensis]